jgi:hypothetical protein
MSYLYEKYGADMLLDLFPTNDYGFEYDLKLDAKGRLEYSRDRESISEALARRIATPKNGYARMVRLGDSVEVLNREYGTDLDQYLSEPISFIDEIQSTALVSGDKEKRTTITLLRLSKSMETTGIGRIDLEIEYKINGLEFSDTQTQQLDVSF